MARALAGPVRAHYLQIDVETGPRKPVGESAVRRRVWIMAIVRIQVRIDLSGSHAIAPL